VAGIVTAPLNKEAMRRAGYTYPGHTELLAEQFGVQHYSLVLARAASSSFTSRRTCRCAVRWS
jgi:4-hydroxy-L-threonine phosphate dehydrogenase PdxA